MKLKQKTAKEYTDALPCRYTESAKELIAEDFIAGFKKAREMAVDLMKKPFWMAVRDMPKLGEEEVE